MGTLAMIGVLMLLLRAASVTAEIGCTAVTPFLSACLNFVTYGSPEPIPGSPCCNAVVNLNDLADTSDHRQSLCRCLSGHFMTGHAPNVAATTLLPRFCGALSLGFNIGPKTDCN
ncbi:hypothetical protein Acr_03g0000110 [Actinidia rufa]|uniref:Non-specific lipid-transfer protein n=1 Tax=Actinidia rufa TaxID=165716 RepID=A0A7J0EC63_9ERIC|nr:hypothetical protein Acr_03g0000110 [Actinidia rufa]